jgi:hypothetical protein
MGEVAMILPLVLQGLELVPKLTSTGKDVYDGVRSIWEGVTTENPPTPEEQKQYDDAMEVAFQALMKSTDDVRET